ncbi:probable cysteine protease RD19D [Diaphorina citri]|uniref:Probable cysteine protease RD19D n=1 Tax=Diaphorina citri TaxID=121845 RepID=A0A1S3CXJ9_DIACI|nr:probable cysteine protease RD19D [Diaphorina citri]KAI5734080.1 hypothetical protein M8J77_002168 [Diaphorina citri]
MLESQYAIKHGTLLPLSKSQLIECNIYNQGCQGGGFNKAIQYLKHAGLEAEADYPFRNQNGVTGRCAYDARKVKVRVSDFLVFNGSDTFRRMLYHYGPLVAGMNGALLQDYNGKLIRKNDVCPSENLNHAVVIVGYGMRHQVPVWIVRNSWGRWGPDDGYFTVERGTNACGIESYGGICTRTLNGVFLLLNP